MKTYAHFFTSITTIVLAFLIPINVYATPSQESAPLYTQTIKFENKKHRAGDGYYYYFAYAGVSHCKTCQPITLAPNYMTINYATAQDPVKGALFVSTLQLRQDQGYDHGNGNNYDPIVCEYELEISHYNLPFTIQPTGDFYMEERSHPSGLTASHSSVLCDMITYPAIAIKKDRDDYIFQFTDFPKKKEE